MSSAEATSARLRMESHFSEDINRRNLLGLSGITCRNIELSAFSTKRLTIYPTKNEVKPFCDSANRLCLEEDFRRGQSSKECKVKISYNLYQNNSQKIRQGRLQGTLAPNSMAIRDLQQSADIFMAANGSCEPEPPQDPPSFHQLYPTEDCSMDFDTFAFNEFSPERPSAMPLHEEKKDFISVNSTKKDPDLLSTLRQQPITSKMEYNQLDECKSCPETTMKHNSSLFRPQSSDISIQSTYSSNRSSKHPKNLLFRRGYLDDYMDNRRKESFDDSVEINMDNSTRSCSHSESSCDEKIANEKVLNFLEEQKILMECHNRQIPNIHLDENSGILNESDNFLEGDNLAAKLKSQFRRKHRNTSLHRKHPKYSNDIGSDSSEISETSNRPRDASTTTNGPLNDLIHREKGDKYDSIGTVPKNKKLSNLSAFGRATYRSKSRNIKMHHESSDDSTYSTDRTEKNYVICMGCVRILEASCKAKIVCCPVCRVATPIFQGRTNN